MFVTGKLKVDGMGNCLYSITDKDHVHISNIDSGDELIHEGKSYVVSLHAYRTAAGDFMVSGEYGPFVNIRGPASSDDMERYAAGGEKYKPTNAAKAAILKAIGEAWNAEVHNLGKLFHSAQTNYFCAKEVRIKEELTQAQAALDKAQKAMVELEKDRAEYYEKAKSPGV